VGGGHTKGRMVSGRREDSTEKIRWDDAGSGGGNGGVSLGVLKKKTKKKKRGRGNKGMAHWDHYWKNKCVNMSGRWDGPRAKHCI